MKKRTEPPFYPSRTHKIGDRVKIQRHAADASRGFYYGTIHHQAVNDALMVQWDENIPFLGRISTDLCAILV